MKKAEAISILAASVRPREAKDRARYDEAVRMAIEALKCSETPKSSEQNAETAQADHIADTGRKVEQTGETAQNVQNEDLILRKAAIEALARMMPRSYTPDGSHPADEEIFRAQEIFADCIKTLEILPSAQPEVLACGEGELSAEPEQRWIPCSERLPEEGSYLVWMPFAPPEYRIAVAERCDGYWNIKTPISAWMPLPEPYRGGDE